MTERAPEEPERVLEGTWEEVARQAAEWRGRRVKLFIYSPDDLEPATPAARTEPKNLLEALGDYVGAAASGGEEVLSEHTGEQLTDHLVRKRREGRL